MSGITISLRDSGAAVAFPFELKGVFRAAFPSAKWEPSGKVWTVGPRSVKRLKSWVAEVEASGIVEELATRDEREMSADEVRQLRIQLSNMCRALEKANSSKESGEALKSEADKLRAHLTATASEYDAAKAVADAVAAKAAKATAEMSAQVQQTVNTEALDEALHQLRFLRPAQAAERAKHEKYTKVVRDIVHQIEAIGITSDTLRAVAGHNYNRFDRDGRPWLDRVTYRVAKLATV